MRILYLAYSEEVGEAEAMFDQDGTLLDIWSCNDATWRRGYFSGFMRSLGYVIENAPDWMQQKLVDRATELWGPFEN